MTHILVVDDEPDILRLFSAILARFPEVEVTTARRASVARAILMRRSVDLMVTDARMPGESGIALAAAAAELGVAAIIMTGDHDWAVAHGAPSEHILEKPFEAATVDALIARFLASKGYPAPAPRGPARPTRSGTPGP
jgi:DNA-binding NtrC family response regulator